MIVLQVILAVGLFFVALLLFAMVRQIGVITQRLPKIEDAEEAGPLEPGTMLPLREFTTYQAKSQILFAPGMHGGAVLVIASFSCPACQLLLRGLRGCPDDVRRGIILFMLDNEIERRYQKRIHKTGLEDYPIVEALDLSRSFRIRRAPFAYVVDGEGIVREATALASLDDLVTLTRRHLSVALSKGGNVHVREMGGCADSSAGTQDVPEAVAP